MDRVSMEYCRWKRESFPYTRIQLQFFRNTRLSYFNEPVDPTGTEEEPQEMFVTSIAKENIIKAGQTPLW